MALDNYNFSLVTDFEGYNSSRDKTNVSERCLIRGSKNVYKKLSGTIAVRPGLKRRTPADTTNAGVKSTYTWSTSFGATRALRVCNSKFQVESLLLDGINYAFYDLMTSLTLTRFVFDTWWDATNKKDKLLFVIGNSNTHDWSGGITKVASGTTTTIVKSDTSTTWAQDGFTAATLATIGDGTTQFDITNPAGTTFRYTYDTNGTNPNITAATAPVGTYIYINAQNFTAANNGLFLVTGSGANFFDVTNAAGVAENNKTIGTGAIYLKFSKVLLIGSTAYGYTSGETTSTLTGVFPSAAAATASVAVQAVIINISSPVASGFNNDFCKTINNRFHIGSYTSRSIYISDQSDYTSFTVPSPRTPGTAELLTLDNTGKGISVSQGNAMISAGQSDWYEVSYTKVTVGSTLTEQTKVDKKPTAINCAAYAHEFIDVVGDNIVYLAVDQQLRNFGTFRNVFSKKFPSLSQPVADELSQEDFTGGHVKAIGDFIYITAPVNGRDWMFQTRESLDSTGNIVAERLWHPPQVRNISRFEVINGVVFGYSNANPQTYQVWDTMQWHDDSPSSSNEPLPYAASMKMSYRQLPQKGGLRKQGLLDFDKVYYEGYMTQGTNLYSNVYFDYQGATDLQSPVISNGQGLADFFTGSIPPSMGDSSLGDNPLGDGLVLDANDQESVPKFRAITNVTSSTCFEFCLEIYSADVDSRWEILCLGANMTESTELPSFITK